MRTSLKITNRQSIPTDMDSKDWCFFNLTAEDMEIVRSGPLQDSHILHFSGMIYKLAEFPLPQPPQMYLLVDDIKPIPMSQDCIQFVFIPPPENDEGIGHWVCCYFNGRNIFVYDSANYGLCKEIKMFIGKLFPYIDMKTVKFPKVQQQKNNQDCGIFAVAFAMSIIFGLKPETVQYKSSEVLRDHLVTIFKNREMEHFPHRGKLKKNLPSLALAIHRRRRARYYRIVSNAEKQMLARCQFTRNANLTHEVGDSNKSSHIPPNCDKIDDIQTLSTEVASTQQILHTKLNDNKTNEEGNSTLVKRKFSPSKEHIHQKESSQKEKSINQNAIDTAHVQILPVDADKKSKSSKKKKHRKENDVTITILEDPIKRKMMKLVEDHFETIEKSKQFSTKYYARKLRSSEKKLQELEKRTMAEEERYLKEMEYMNRKMDCLDSSVS